MNAKELENEVKKDVELPEEAVETQEEVVEEAVTEEVTEESTEEEVSTEKKGFFKKLINRGSHISKVLNINTIEGGLNKYVTGEHFSGKS